MRSKALEIQGDRSSNFASKARQNTSLIAVSKILLERLNFLLMIPSILEMGC